MQHKIVELMESCKTYQKNNQHFISVGGENALILCPEKSRKIDLWCLKENKNSKYMNSGGFGGCGDERGVRNDKASCLSDGCFGGRHEVSRLWDFRYESTFALWFVCL